MSHISKSRNWNRDRGKMYHLAVKPINLVHSPALMVASSKVYMLWIHDLVSKQGQNDFS